MTTKTTKKNDKVMDVRPTRAEIQQAVVWFCEHTNRVPCLVGPTASGKTRMAMAIAHERGAKLISILLQQDTPEEIAGFQAPIGDQLLALTPFWFNKAQEELNAGGRVVLFFDELGLSHEATRGAVYTFLRDREIRGKHLSCAHADEACTQCVIILAAMNPAELAPAMLSRIAMLHVPADREHMMTVAATSLAKRIVSAAPITGDHAHTSNQPPNAPATFDLSALAVVNAFDGAFFRLPDGTKNAIVSAVVPPSVIEEVFREDMLTTPSVSKQIENIDLIVPIMRALSVPDAVANAVALWTEFPNMKFEDAIPAIAELQLALSEDEDKQSAFFDVELPQSTSQWWEAAGEAGAEAMAKYLEGKNYFKFDPNKPGGKILDNMLLQAPPDQNEMQHLMSKEALAEWKVKWQQ